MNESDNTLAILGEKGVTILHSSHAMGTPLIRDPLKGKLWDAGNGPLYLFF
ncbi:MAG: hypothetical protein WC446_03205 [Candidatus Paceibacterota bacterium]|jgi:hypothetical protein